MGLQPSTIAEIAHEANRAYCEGALSRWALPRWADLKRQDQDHFTDLVAAVTEVSTPMDLYDDMTKRWALSMEPVAFDTISEPRKVQFKLMLAIIRTLKA